MKISSFLTCCTLLGLLACNKEESVVTSDAGEQFYKTDIKKIEGTTVSTNFTARLVTMSGEPIKQASDLTPGGTYRIIVQGERPAYYRIKFADGFDVIDKPVVNTPLNGGTPAKSVSFTVKLHKELGGGVYASIVPIHFEREKMLREHPKGFLLPGE